MNCYRIHQKSLNFIYPFKFYSNFTNKNVSWLHFSWATQYNYILWYGTTTNCNADPNVTRSRLSTNFKGFFRSLTYQLPPNFVKIGRVVFFVIINGTIPHLQVRTYTINAPYSNCGPISYRFHDKRRFRLKIAKFSQPPVYLTLPLKGFPLELGNSAWGSKYEYDVAIPCQERRLTIFSVVWIQ